MVYYVNGEFVEPVDAKVSLSDHGFLYGDGCFEGVSVVEGKILHLDEHVDRFIHSLNSLRIDLGLDKEAIREAIVETARRNGLATAASGYMRPIASRGDGPMGIKWSSSLSQPLFAVLAHVGDKRVAVTGDAAVMTACATTRLRPAPGSREPRVKSNNYLPNILAYLEAEERGFDVGLLTDETGHIAEGHAMNVFAVHGNAVRTPPRTEVLDGVTRRHVLRIADDLGYRCEEGPMTMYDLTSADEAFVTSSLEGVAALSRVENVEFAGPIPGEVTSRIRARYVEYALESGHPVPA